MVSFIDTSTGNLVSGLVLPTGVSSNSLPFFSEDAAEPMNVYLLAPIPNNQPSQTNYSVITPSVATNLYAQLDNDLNPAAPYTSQATWVADPTNQYWIGSMPMNTAGISGLFTGSNATAPAWLRISYFPNGVQTTVCSLPITIKQGNPTGGSVVPVPLTALALETAKGLFVPIVGAAGAGFYLTATDGSKLFVSAVGNGDGTARPNFATP